MKSAKGQGQGERESISQKIEEANVALTGLIRSIGMEIEERITLDDQVKNISHETEYLLDRIDNLAKDQQRKMLTAYKKFLEQNLSAVNYRLKKVG